MYKEFPRNLYSTECHIFKDYLDLLNVLRPPLTLGYTGSMRMIDKDEKTLCTSDRLHGNKIQSTWSAGKGPNFAIIGNYRLEMGRVVTPWRVLGGV